MCDKIKSGSVNPEDYIIAEVLKSSFFTRSIVDDINPVIFCTNKLMGHIFLSVVSIDGSVLDKDFRPTFVLW